MFENLASVGQAIPTILVLLTVVVILEILWTYLFGAQGLSILKELSLDWNCHMNM
jgi:hypothetical protein